MSYEKARQLLAQANTSADRMEAVRAAMREGMPLSEIERYLDWLDQVRGSASANQDPPAESSPR